MDEGVIVIGVEEEGEDSVIGERSGRELLANAGSWREEPEPPAAYGAARYAVYCGHGVRGLGRRSVRRGQ